MKFERWGEHVNANRGARPTLKRCKPHTETHTFHSILGGLMLSYSIGFDFYFAGIDSADAAWKTPPP